MKQNKSLDCFMLPERALFAPLLRPCHTRKSSMSNKSNPTMYWLIDEDNDWEGETFGLAVPVSPESTDALGRWETTYTHIMTDDEGRCCGELSFHGQFTSERLGAMGEGSSNSYSSRVHFLNNSGLVKLIACIDDLPAGESLTMYKGNLTALKADGDHGETLFDTWDYSESGAMGICDDDDDEEDEDDETDPLLRRVLVKYEESFGRSGSLSDIFVCTAVELTALKVHKPVYMDDCLGKHSEVYCDLDDKTLTVLTDDQDFIEKAMAYGLLNSGCGLFSTVADGWANNNSELTGPGTSIDDIADQLTPEQLAALQSLYPAKDAGSDGDGDDDDTDDE